LVDSVDLVRAGQGQVRVDRVDRVDLEVEQAGPTQVHPVGPVKVVDHQESGRRRCPPMCQTRPRIRAI
jgi:hypothetical protein